MTFGLNVNPVSPSPDDSPRPASPRDLGRASCRLRSSFSAALLTFALVAGSATEVAAGASPTRTGSESKIKAGEDAADDKKTGEKTEAYSDKADAQHGKGHGGSRLSDEVIPLAKLPDRPKPLLELGSPFLGTGRIRRGFRIPGGAVWQPSFLLFGSFRSGLSVLDTDDLRTTQWSNRLDLFGNLYLSGTERVVIGLRPLDDTVSNGRRVFSGYQHFSPDPLSRGGFQDGFNFDPDTITHLFFEGDIGELFPALDPNESRAMDLGFSVGRQPINFQEGLLINDFVDAVGITRNNLKPRGAVNVRVTGLFAWNQINRDTPSSDAFIRNLEADSARLYGAFTEVDWRSTTMAVDALFVQGGKFNPGLVGGTPGRVSLGSGLYGGISFVQRLGLVNSSIRVLGSIPIGDETDESARALVGDPVGGGALLFGEFSWTPHHTHDLVYLNGFAAFSDYRAAALDPTIPGPLARAGFLFAGPGLGNFPGALSPTASDVIGGALGYQKFMDDSRQQLLMELAGRVATDGCASATDSCGDHSLAGGARYQRAFGRRFVLVLDGYAAYQRLRGAAAADFGEQGRFRLGSRLEWLVKF